MPKLGGVFPRGKVLVFKLFCMLEIFHNDKFKKKKKAEMGCSRKRMESGVLGAGFSCALGPPSDVSKSRPRPGPQGPVSSSPAGAGILLDVFIWLLLFSHQVMSDSLQPSGL